MIKTNTGFLNQSATPLDSRQVVETLDDLLALDTNIIYNGLECYVSSLDCKYKYHEDYNETDTGHWKNISSISAHTHKASEVKFTKLDGTTTTVQNALGGGEFTPIIINKPASFKPYEYNLIAEIQLPDNYMTHHNLSFMCLNNRPQIANTFDRDADIYRFDLHMGTPMENAYTSEPKLRFYGFDLYEYPTADSSVSGINLYKDLAKCIKGYYDVTNRKIYIFLISTNSNYFNGDLGTTKIEYTGNGTIVDSFQVSNFWDYEYLKWTQVCELEDLESPTIFKLGGDSSENSKTYTTLDELGLTADATVDDVISALKEGETAIVDISEFTNYLTMFPNYCTNDQYAILQVEKKNDNRAFIEWRQKEGNAYAIAGLNSNNQFTNWGNIVRFKKDGFADDSIVCIGNAVSNDGTVQTLESLGFSADILLWENGVYRVSHFGGLVNLPSGLDTINNPAFRLEHHNLVKNNVNPNNSTYAPRHSIIYCDNGDIYCRFYKSGATAGVYVNDTGWQQIITENSKTDPYSCTGYTVLTGTEDLFTLAPGHYATTKADMTYNYPITDSSSLTAHIYVLGCLNDPTNNKGYRIILYFDNKDRMYRINEWWGGFAHGWQNMKTKTTLVTNTSTLKLDVTKKNTAWYGAIKLTYLYDTSPVEVEIDFKGATDTLKWTISKGQKYIKSITYTQDADNKAHYTIGIEFSGTTYGCYQAEVIGSFADINSLTADAFTGDTTAVYGNPFGKNNGVTLVSAPEDLGLSSPCTTVQLVQAMRNTFNKTITSGAIGVFNNGGNTITDAPSDYGLLHIEVFGHDRVMIRYDGIGSSIYAGSWIGRVKGSNGTFSEVTFERENNIYSTGEEVIGTWIDGSTIYRKVLSISSIDAKTSSSTVELGDAPVSGQNMLKIEGFLNLIGNQCFIHYPNVADENEYINATLSIANGHVKLTGTWKYPISKGAIIMEYLKS